MSYRESINNFERKIFKWYRAIPLGLVFLFLSKITRGTLSDVFSLFSALFPIGIVTGIVDAVRYFTREKKIK